MRGSRTACTLLTVAWCVLGLAPASVSAQDGPAADAREADPLDAEVEAIRRQVAVGSWKSGKFAIEKFFAAHADDPRVAMHIPALETDLMKCLYRLATPQAKPLELLGRGATKYDVVTRRVEFDCARFDESMGWEREDELRFFDAMFDDEVCVEMSEGTARNLTVYLGLGPETHGAYAIRVEPSSGDYETVAVYRIDATAAAPIQLGTGGLLSSSSVGVRYSLNASKVTTEVVQPKEWHHPRKFDSYSDATYRGGFVAIRGAEGSRFRISGKLDPVFAKRQAVEAESSRFRWWRAVNWRREDALPAWVIASERGSVAWADGLPASFAPSARPRLVELQRRVFDAEAPESGQVPSGLEGTTGAWQAALLAFAEGRLADSDEACRVVLAAEPGFAAVHALDGRIRLARGAEEDAAASFRAAIRLDANFAPAVDGLALLALRAGDAAAMQRILSDGASRRVGTKLTIELRKVLLRLRRGPDWKKQFEASTPNFVVTSDASFAVCSDVGKTLEECVEIYAAKFRPRPKKTRARVRVFVGYESYAEYLTELGADPDGTLGMYLPAIRELCVYLHEHRSELSNTIRHEAFHQYLHEFLDDAPIWFNEGYAEFFGFSRRKLGKSLVGQVGESQATVVAALVPKFVPLERLFLMRPTEFMARADVHYAQSWAVVHVLRGAKDATLGSVLDRYLDALLAGRSQQEAYAAVLAPVVPQIEKMLRAFK